MPTETKKGQAGLISINNTDISIIDETTPLAINKEIPKESYLPLRYFACGAVAFPTACLNAISIISNDPNDFGKITSLEQLAETIKTASDFRIAMGVVTFICAESVLFFLNRKYLLGSVHTAFDLLKQDLFAIYNIVTKCQSPDSMKKFLRDNILLIWSFITSLIFAEIGSSSLAFLGISGRIIGFSLSQIVYFSTRFASSTGFFNHFFDENVLLKQELLKKIAVLKAGALFEKFHDITQRNHFSLREINPLLPVADALFYEDDLEMLGEDHDEDLIYIAYNRINYHWSKLQKDTMRLVLYNFISPCLGAFLVVSTTIPITVSLIPSGIQGVNELLNTHIGESSDYHNMTSLTLGSFIAAMTVFFYELNIYDLPKNFLKTVINMHEMVISNDITGAMLTLMKTIAAFGASYLTSIGFKFVAESAVSNSYLSYMGSFFTKIIPDLFFTGVITMLWSHLQSLINASCNTSHIAAIDWNNNNVENVVKQNKVISLLENPSTNLINSIQLSSHRSSLFSRVCNSCFPCFQDIFYPASHENNESRHCGFYS